MGGIAVIREAFARREDPYAGGDLLLARRLDCIITAAGTAFALVLLPLWPPTVAIGNAGWAVAALIALLSGGASLYDRLKRGGRTWNTLLAWNYVGLTQIAAIQWLAGSSAPYRDLFVLATAFVGGLHPPRRLLPYLAIVNAIALAPLLFEQWDAQFAGSTIALVVVWSTLALVTSIANANARLHREGSAHAEALARADALTGLGNRRAFDEALAAEIARGRRLDSPLSLLLADLNGFKEINDVHGHLAGDECLRQVAAVLRDEIRLHDRCFRWGGDEFAAILTDTDGSAAELIAERVSGAVSERCGQPDGEPLTIGVAHAQLADGMTADDVVEEADTALRSAKAARS